MEDPVTRLTAEPSSASYTEVDGDNQRERPVEFLDFFVNGRPLRDLVDIPDDWEQPLHETTALRDDWKPRAVVEYLDRLLGVLPGDYDDGRVALLLCPICGDLWCGALSMEVTLLPESVTWQKFGWQGDVDDDEPHPFPALSFTFDRTQYEQLLGALRQQYEKRAVVPEPLRLLARLFKVVAKAATK